MASTRAPGHQVAFFLGELADAEPARRLAAVKGLSSVGARSAWRELVAVADGDAEASVRVAAMRALGRLAIADATAVLLAGLRDREPGVRVAAARSLKAIDVVGEQVVSALAMSLADSEWKVREAAAGQLGRIGVATVEVVDALVGALSVREDWRTGIAWSEARRALDKLICAPASAAVTIDGLRRGLRSAPADAARYGCLLLLGRWLPGEAREFALAALTDAYGPTRRHAACLLTDHPRWGNLEPLTAALVAERNPRIWWSLRQALEALIPLADKEEMVRMVADGHPGAVAAFARAKHHTVTEHARRLLGDARTRAAAASHLGVFGAETDADLLLPLLDDPDEVTRAEAVGALRKIFARFPADPARQRSLPKLLGLLSDRSWWVRHYATQTLEALADEDELES